MSPLLHARGNQALSLLVCPERLLTTRVRGQLHLGQQCRQSVTQKPPRFLQCRLIDLGHLVKKITECSLLIGHVKPEAVGRHCLDKPAKHVARRLEAVGCGDRAQMQLDDQLSRSVLPTNDNTSAIRFPMQVADHQLRFISQRRFEFIAGQSRRTDVLARDLSNLEAQLVDSRLQRVVNRTAGLERRPHVPVEVAQEGLSRRFGVLCPLFAELPHRRIAAEEAQESDHEFRRYAAAPRLQKLAEPLRGIVFERVRIKARNRSVCKVARVRLAGWERRPIAGL